MSAPAHIVVGKNVFVHVDGSFLKNGDTLHYGVPFVRLVCLESVYRYYIVSSQEHATLSDEHKFVKWSPTFFDVFPPGEHRLFGPLFELKHKPTRQQTPQPANKSFFACASSLHKKGSLCQADHFSEDLRVCDTCKTLEYVWHQNHMDASTMYDIEKFIDMAPSSKQQILIAFMKLDLGIVAEHMFTQQPEHRFADLEIIASVPLEVATAYCATATHSIMPELSPMDKQVVFNTTERHRFSVYGTAFVTHGDQCVYLREIHTSKQSKTDVCIDPDMYIFLVFIREHMQHIGILSDINMTSFAVQGNLSTFGNAEKQIQVINTTPGAPMQPGWVRLSDVTRLDPQNGTIIVLGPLTLGDAMQLFMKGIKWGDGLQVVWISNPYAFVSGAYNVFGIFAGESGKFVDVSDMRDEGMRPNPGPFTKSIYKLVDEHKQVEIKHYGCLGKGDRSPMTRPIYGTYQKSVVILVTNRSSIADLTCALFYSEDVSVQITNKNKDTKLAFYHTLYADSTYNPLKRILKM